MRAFKILVPCKRVIDYAVRVRIQKDGRSVEKANVKHSMNPFDEIALEESLRIREKLGSEIVKEVLAVSIGTKKSQDTIRTALAMGADSGIHVEVEDESLLSPPIVATILKELATKDNGIQLIVMGKQAIDDDCGHTGQILAGMLKWPQSTFTSKIKFENDSCKASREVDTGLEEIKTQIPAVITSDLRLNEPRYATLANIMKSKNKKIEAIKFSDMAAAQSTQLLTVNKMFAPTKRSSAKILETTDQLLKIISSI